MFHGMVGQIPRLGTPATTAWYAGYQAGKPVRYYAPFAEKTGEPVQKGVGKGRKVQDRNPKLLCRPQYEGCGANGYNGPVLNADTVFIA